MLHINFIVFDSSPKTITGGHRYDQNLIETVKKVPAVEVSVSEAGCHRRIPKFFKPVIEFIKGIKKSKGDIIIFNSSKCLRFFPLMLWLKLFSNKKIYSIHHLFIYPDFTGLKKSVYKFTETWFLKLSDRIIVPSPYIYSRLKEFIPERNLLYWKIPFEMKQEFPLKPIPGNLAFAGTIEPRKGLKYLFESLKKLNDDNISYHLNILGKVVDEEYHKEIKSYASENKLNISFLGFISPEERNRIFSLSDIFVFPSLHEGYGMVLVEAQVYGLPIVCFDNSSMPLNVFNDINGFAVPTRDTDAFAKRIAEIITDRKLRDRLSKGAIDNLSNQWSYQKFSDEVISYFSSLSD